MAMGRFTVSKRKLTRRYVKKGYIPPKVKNYVKRAIKKDKELKHQAIYYAVSSTDGTTMHSVLLNGIEQGNTESTREGDRITITGVQWKGYIYNGITTNQLSPQQGRLILVQDKQANFSAPTVGGIFDITNTSMAEGALREEQYKERFKIHKDKWYKINPNYGYVTDANTNSNLTDQLIQFKGYKRLNIPVIYSGAGDTVAVILRNTLYFCWSATHAGQILKMEVKVFFKE